MFHHGQSQAVKALVTGTNNGKGHSNNNDAYTFDVMLPWNSPSTNTPLKMFLANCARVQQSMHDNSAYLSLSNQRLRSNSDKRTSLATNNKHSIPATTKSKSYTIYVFIMKLYMKYTKEKVSEKRNKVE